jgi:2-(1,2-epoxy-1,2-dihydrophenyl)acetyl-CoA isomerase
VSAVEVSREGAVLTITLNRPDVLNALNREVNDALRAALEQAADPTIRAVVLTGAGRAFCAGQDLGELRAGSGDIADRLREQHHRIVLAIRTLEKPVIAVVNGPAAGGGLALALACDVRIASEDATFVPAFTGIGLAPDAGATWFAERMLGTARAFEWLTTGRSLPAAEAREWGLVSEVVPAAELATRAAEVAELFSAMPTRAVWEIKRLLDSAGAATLAEQLELEARALAGLVKTTDFTEGVAAFYDKRVPAFSGAPPERLHPVQLIVHDDLRRWRLTVLLRALLAAPHLLVATAWMYLALVVLVVNWFATLIRGQTPRGIHDWTARFLRYWTHVQAYVWLIADPYPSFRGWYGTYPVDLEVAPPERQERWKTFLRGILAIPAYALMTVLGTVLEVIAVIAWVICLALGRVPRGMRDLMAYCLRYQAQTYAYLFLLTSRYPTLASGSGFQFEEA